MEKALCNRSLDGVTERLHADRIDADVLRGALTIKELAGQINVVIHAVGILVSLPHILDEDEVVLSLSLGAGNTGRAHDLETDRRVAEFKFIEWRGGAESIRQNSVFADVFTLASASTDKRRILYVTGKRHPLRFLSNNRALHSVLSKNRAIEERFRKAHGEQFQTVSSYWNTVKDAIEIVDLREVVPAFADEAHSGESAASTHGPSI